MRCGMAQGTELHFVSSGMSILPHKVEYESDKTNYDYARVDITREAGDYIDNNSIIPEPVEIHTGGRKLCDVYLGEDSLTLDKDRAYLELTDGRKVLERGVLDKRFHTTTLGDLIDWFRTQVENADTKDVITGVELVDENPDNDINADESRETEDFLGTTYADSLSEGEIDPDEASGLEKSYMKFDAWMQRSMNGLGPMKNREEGGLDFNQANLATALKMIEEEFGLQSYMTDDRVLKIGDPEVEPNLFYAGEGRNMWYVNEYNLTTNPTNIQLVSVKGGIHKVNRKMNHEYPTGSNPERNNKMRWWAFASTESPRSDASDREIVQNYKESVYDTEIRNNDGPEGRVVTLNHKKTDDKSTLYNLAVRRMMQEMINKVSGSIVIQPAKSSINMGWPQDLKVGDSIAVFPGNQQVNCVDTLEEDLFVVTGISHSIDGQSGWEMELQLSRTPQQDIFVAAMPWPEVPEEGSAFEDFQEYYRKAFNYDNGSYFEDIDGDGEMG